MPKVPSLRPIQTAFTCHAWTSPDESYKAIFPRLDLSCEFDTEPGIVIVATADCRSATASEVMNLRTELSMLLSNIQNPVVYWLRCQKRQERTELLSSLTKHPVYFG